MMQSWQIDVSILIYYGYYSFDCFIYSVWNFSVLNSEEINIGEVQSSML